MTDPVSSHPDCHGPGRTRAALGAGQATGRRLRAGRAEREGTRQRLCRRRGHRRGREHRVVQPRGSRAAQFPAGRGRRSTSSRRRPSSTTRARRRRWDSRSAAPAATPAVRRSCPTSIASMAINDEWHVGIGINAPFGLKTEYDDGWLGRYQALKSDIKTINVNPAVGWRATKDFWLGAGASYQQFKATLTNNVNYTAALAQGYGQAAAAGLIPASSDPVAHRRDAGPRLLRANDRATTGRGAGTSARCTASTATRTTTTAPAGSASPIGRRSSTTSPATSLHQSDAADAHRRAGPVQPRRPAGQRRDQSDPALQRRHHPRRRRCRTWRRSPTTSGSTTSGISWPTSRGRAGAASSSSRSCAPPAQHRASTRAAGQFQGHLAGVRRASTTSTATRSCCGPASPATRRRSTTRTRSARLPDGDARGSRRARSTSMARRLQLRRRRRVHLGQGSARSTTPAEIRRRTASPPTG